MRKLIVLLAAMAATPALCDDDFSYFRSPTGNIHCAIMVLSDYKGVRCDLTDFTPSFPRPADCDLDWGYALEVGERGKGAPLCAGDTARAPDGQARVLGYGETLARAGFSCTSTRGGMTCRNKAGHGFTAARKRQVVF